jgi:hypothetical protein
MKPWQGSCLGAVLALLIGGSSLMLEAKGNETLIGIARKT